MRHASVFIVSDIMLRKSINNAVINVISLTVEALQGFIRLVTLHLH